ncbi:MAG: ATPase P [Candidatus Dadabacteria bacterium]|nr:MAG: ATPase P [Candidatus Dadabacteria bacterium]
MIRLEIPGVEPLEIRTVLADFNGTLAVDGRLSAGVRKRLEALAAKVRVVVATADTFGTVEAEIALPGVEVRRLTAGFQSAQKEKILEQLGPEATVALGNGVNDHRMVARAALGIAVLGPEGAAWDTLRRARVVVPSAEDALDLLLEPRRLVATLRD